MTDVEVLDQSTPEDALERYAATIRDAQRAGRDAIGEVIDSYFTIGDALLGARQVLASNEAFGAWFNAQEFGFTRQWGHVLRSAAENDVAVRRALSSQLADGNGPNLEKAVKEVMAPARVPRTPKPAPTPAQPDTRTDIAVDNPPPDSAEPVAATDDSAPPVVDTAPDVPAPADAPFDAMRDAIRCAGDVRADLTEIIGDALSPDEAADRILAVYVLTPRTET